MSSKAERLFRADKRDGIGVWSVGAMALSIATALLMLVPMIASAADDPAAAQYNNQTPDSEVLSGGGEGESIGSLPFTGTDILLLAAAAIVLFAVAATLRRFAQRRESAG